MVLTAGYRKIARAQTEARARGELVGGLATAV